VWGAHEGVQSLEEKYKRGGGSKVLGLFKRLPIRHQMKKRVCKGESV